MLVCGIEAHLNNPTCEPAVCCLRLRLTHIAEYSRSIVDCQQYTFRNLRALHWEGANFVSVLCFGQGKALVAAQHLLEAQTGCRIAPSRSGGDGAVLGSGEALLIPNQRLESAPLALR